MMWSTPRGYRVRDPNVPARPKVEKVSDVVRRLVWGRDEGRCRICGVACKRQKADRYDADPTLGEIDHIVARCHGGNNDPANLRLLCKRCNRGKARHERRTKPRGYHPSGLV